MLFFSNSDVDLTLPGLAVVDYTHSTAPNRRYPDLVTQRMVRSILLGQPLPYTSDELDEIANRCSELQENVAKVPN